MIKKIENKELGDGAFANVNVIHLDKSQIPASCEAEGVGGFA